MSELGGPVRKSVYLQQGEQEKGDKAWGLRGNMLDLLAVAFLTTMVEYDPRILSKAVHDMVMSFI